MAMEVYELLVNITRSFPKETWDRANRFEEFNIQAGADWEDLHLKDEKSLS